MAYEIRTISFINECCIMFYLVVQYRVMHKKQKYQLGMAVYKCLTNDSIKSL